MAYHCSLFDDGLTLANPRSHERTDSLLSSPPTSMLGDTFSSGPPSPGSCHSTPTIVEDEGGTGVFIPAANPTATPRGTRRTRRNRARRRTPPPPDSSLIAAQLAATQPPVEPALLPLLQQLHEASQLRQLASALDLATLSTLHALASPKVASPQLPLLDPVSALALGESQATSPASDLHSMSGWLAPEALTTCLAGLQLHQTNDDAWAPQQDAVWARFEAEAQSLDQGATQLPDSWTY